MFKPDIQIFRLALDLAQTSPERAVFIDNTPIFLQIFMRLGIQSILHDRYESPRSQLTFLGLETNDAT